jgi:hypothetical protein
MNGRPVAGALAITVLLLALAATPTLADGVFFPDSMYRDLYESTQKAVILYGNCARNCTGNCTGSCTEHLILSTSWDGDAEDFAWVVPLPNVPEITVTDAALFSELSELTAVDIPNGDGGSFGCTGEGAVPTPEGGVDVIEEEVVGPYATAILSATNATALADWLNGNGYVLPSEAEEIVSEYIEKEWYFLATKINALDEGTGEALTEGAIEPIVLSFACNETVFPLRISSLSASNTTAPEILIYVLADRLMVPEQYPLYVGYGNWEDNAFTLEFGANVSVQDLPDWYEILPELVSTYLPSDEFYLTKLRGWIDGDQMVDINMVSYGGDVPVGPLTENSSNHEDIVFLALIVGPAFGLRLWRKRRKMSASGGPLQ